MKRLIATGVLGMTLALGSAAPVLAVPIWMSTATDDDGVVLPYPAPQLADTGAGDRALITLGFVGGGLLVAGAGVFALTAWRSSRRWSSRTTTSTSSC